MATFQRFEEIEAWQLARDLTKMIYRLSGQGDFGRDFPLRDQLRRASASVMANIAEGYERAGNAEFIQFLAIAKGSVGEVRSHLYIALDQAYLTQQQFDEVATLCLTIAGKIRGLMNSLRASPYKGTKYKPAPLSPTPRP
jgi:four helix bundle protein